MLGLRKYLHILVAYETYHALYHTHALSSQLHDTLGNVNLRFDLDLVEQKVKGNEGTRTTHTSTVTTWDRSLRVWLKLKGQHYNLGSRSKLACNEQQEVCLAKRCRTRGLYVGSAADWKLDQEHSYQATARNESGILSGNPVLPIHRLQPIIFDIDWHVTIRSHCKQVALIVDFHKVFALPLWWLAMSEWQSLRSA